MRVSIAGAVSFKVTMSIITYLTERKISGRIRIMVVAAIAAAVFLPASLSAQSLAESGFIRNTDYKENIEKAVNGNPESQRIVAECYLAGAGVPKDVNEAWKWLVKAAGNGDIDSHYPHRHTPTVTVTECDRTTRSLPIGSGKPARTVITGLRWRLPVSLPKVSVSSRITA